MKIIKCILGLHNWSAPNKEEYPHTYDNGDTKITNTYLTRICRRCGQEKVDREIEVSSNQK